MKSLWIVSRDSCHSAATCFGVWNCSSAGYHLPEENFSSLLFFNFSRNLYLSRNPAPWRSWAQCAKTSIHFLVL